MFNALDSLNSEFIQQPSVDIKRYISPNYSVDENTYLHQLITLTNLSPSDSQLISDEASALITQVRNLSSTSTLINSLLQEYSLATCEGIVLMSIAESLIRIPDSKTADKFLVDRFSIANWEQHLKKSHSQLINASTWGLAVTAKALDFGNLNSTPTNIFSQLLMRFGETVIRKIIRQCVSIIGGQFVFAITIQDALQKANTKITPGNTYSFDMLGEAALTIKDAHEYQKNYLLAIEQLANSNLYNTISNEKNPLLLPSISVKLSALHPRYEISQKDRLMTELYQSVLDIVRKAKAANVAITVDAEEMDRLELSLELFEAIYKTSEVRGWGGFGLAVQAYSKRALPILAWLTALAREQGDLIPVRLVKGAYWDSEIKLSQQGGYPDYPVFTRKEGTDISYLACVRFLFSESARNNLYPQFATHNAHTVSCICNFATHNNYEFQRLHGMGETLYKELIKRIEMSSHESPPVRIYAPVGSHTNLLPYLVRRLLENGANSSFIYQLLDTQTPISSLIQSPSSLLLKYPSFRNDHIPLPKDIFGNTRKNSRGINISISDQYHALVDKIAPFTSFQWQGGPFINGKVECKSHSIMIISPSNHDDIVGRCYQSDKTDIEQAITSAHLAFNQWHNLPVETRACFIESFAELIECNKPELIALLHREAGKTIQDGLDEIREAIDFCRYYASQARIQFSTPLQMPSPTGEANELLLKGRGVFACISPWNFPLAIFVGQITAALVSGNTVIAKPAEQTPLIATRVVKLMVEAGIPGDVVHLLTGEGDTVGKTIVQDKNIAGVVFTGSSNTALKINRVLANRSGPILPFIAETGGQNAMIIDSTALPEQVVKDIIQSAFRSAGQRCSALRVAYVQRDIAPRILELLEGAMAELTIGDPSLLSTDIGPVIDKAAKARLQHHISIMRETAKLIYEVKIPDHLKSDCFVAPVAFEIDTMAQLKEEHFGPILHIILFNAEELDEVISQINDSGYGLTLGINTRNQTTAHYLANSIRAGNIYINRNQVGAMVGVQPFGGEGLSGTGPKAGGPHYLLRFATERTLTTNTTAIGGNTALLSPK